MIPTVPADQTYYSTYPALEVVHDIFTVNYAASSPSLPDDFCGPLETYAVLENMGNLDLVGLSINSIPVSYDPVTRKITAYADSEDYLGTYKVHIYAQL